MPAKKKATRTKTLHVGTIVPTPPTESKPRKSDADLIVDALEEIEQTLSHRLEMIEDQINYLGQSVGVGLYDLDRAVRGEPRPER